MTRRQREGKRRSCRAVFASNTWGAYWGSRAFAEKLFQLARQTTRGRENRNYRSAPKSHGHDEQRAEELLKAGGRAHGWVAGDLPKLRGNDPRKVALAQEIRRQTAVPNGWLAERPSMRSAANVSQILRRAKAAPLGRKLSRYLD